MAKRKSYYKPKTYRTNNPFINNEKWFLGLVAVILLAVTPFEIKILLVLVGIGIGVAFVASNRQKISRIESQTIQAIDFMTGREFEEKLWILFKQLGYKSILTKATADFGADLVLEKNGIRTVVQAKRYGKKVDNKAIQEVVAAKAYYSCTMAIVVTNHFYTQAAKTLAQHNHVELWDRERLIDELVALENSKETHG